MRTIVSFCFILFSFSNVFCQNAKTMGGPNLNFFKLPGATYICSFPQGSGKSCNDTLYSCPTDSFKILMNYNSSPLCGGYQWKKNGVNILGATTNTYTIVDTGMYSIHVNCGINGIFDIGYFKVICIPTAIKENIKTIDFLLFPNPSNDEINIIYDNFCSATIEIVNGLGETLLIKKLTDRQSKIDISFLADGIYCISLNNGKSRSIQKITKNAR